MMSQEIGSWEDNLCEESFVCYESYFKQAVKTGDLFGKEVGFDFLIAIMKYGLYGEKPDENDIVWGYGLESVFTNIARSKIRYEKAKENGKKGGAPEKYSKEQVAELKEQGYTNKEIATALGCSEKTVQRKLKEIREQDISDKTDMTKTDIMDRTGHNRQNLNDNENEKDKVKKKNTTFAKERFPFEEYLST